AIDIYFLPFTPPLKVDTPLDSQLEGFFGPFLSPIIVFLITFLIQQQINGFRREQEMKAASAAANAVGGAVSSAAAGAARSFGERLASVTGDQWAKLALCLLIDALGDATYLLPGLGEAGDALYAPFEFLVLRSLFGGSNTLALFGFVEEALPFSDAIPTATAAWFLQALFPENPVAKFFGIGLKTHLRRLLRRPVTTARGPRSDRATSLASHDLGPIPLCQSFSSLTCTPCLYAFFAPVSQCIPVWISDYIAAVGLRR
ncbi:unnamed protein product, partial [Prorocentrum cordatum]